MTRPCEQQNKRASAWTLRAVLLCTLFAPARAYPQDLEGPAVRERVAKTLVRVLSYDETLSEKAGPALVLGIVAKAGVPFSIRAGEEWTDAFVKVEAYRIRGVPFRTEFVRFQSADGFEKAVRDRHIHALFVCPGMEGEIEVLRAVARKFRVITVGSHEKMVTAGLSVGVWAGDGKINLVVNYPASIAVGARFGSDLLRLARILH